MDGDWHQVYNDDLYTANEVLALIVEYYELGEDVAQALCLQYTTHVGQQRNRWQVKMRNNETLQGIIVTNEDVEEEPLTIHHLMLSCYYPEGCWIKEEVTCNSQFMLDVIPTIGAEM